ncbi:hypothetical protein ABZ614_40185 [Streptomyces sp. NPDC013178]|uniref:DUF6907 domain-containing protein n=1 Tax=Streptomyces sp. NPDC013178 TaxID=3155118 RepID=UPI00340DAC3B
MANHAIAQHAAALSGTLPAIPSQPSVAAMSLPAIKPGYRLVPALIGCRDNSGTAWIECPFWCVEDHTAEANYLDDIVHTSRSEDVGISSFLKQDGDLLMYAMLQADPASPDERLQRAHISIEHEGVPDFHTPEMAEAFADDLIAFASQVRQLARAARLHNDALGGA